MKLNEIFNNYPKMYFNVLPPKDTKPSGSMIAAVMRAQADDQGNEKTEVDSVGGSSKLWPNEKYDRRQEDDVSKAIVQRSRKMLKKSRHHNTEAEEVAAMNRKAANIGTGVVYR